MGVHMAEFPGTLDTQLYSLITLCMCNNAFHFLTSAKSL